MKISEIISQLEGLKSKHGDVDCCVFCSDSDTMEPVDAYLLACGDDGTIARVVFADLETCEAIQGDAD